MLGGYLIVWYLNETAKDEYHLNSVFFSISLSRLRHESRNIPAVFVSSALFLGTPSPPPLPPSPTPKPTITTTTTTTTTTTPWFLFKPFHHITHYSPPFLQPGRLAQSLHPQATSPSEQCCQAHGHGAAAGIYSPKTSMTMEHPP